MKLRSLRRVSVGLSCWCVATMSHCLPDVAILASSQGWYLSVQSPEHFIALVRQIAVQRPGLLMRVSVMLALTPERHKDEDALKHMLLSWRRVVTQSRRWLSGIPPFWLCCWLNSPQCNETVRWFIRTPQDAEVQSATGLDDFAPFSSEERPARHSHLTHAVWLDNLLGWLKKVQGDTERHAPPLFSALRVVCFTSLAVYENNLWQRHITVQTTLSPAASAAPVLLPFPDLALPFIPPPGTDSISTNAGRKRSAMRHFCRAGDDVQLYQ